MILIAESGSTKTDQVAFSNNSNRDVKISTAGFNPHILNTSDIGKQLFQNQELKKLVPQVKKIYFYGTGCSSTSMKKVVKVAIRTLFPTATIEVNHDLEAAVRGTWDGNQPLHPYQEQALTAVISTAKLLLKPNLVLDIYLVMKDREIILEVNSIRQLFMVKRSNIQEMLFSRNLILALLKWLPYSIQKKNQMSFSFIYAFY